MSRPACGNTGRAQAVQFHEQLGPWGIIRRVGKRSKAGQDIFGGVAVLLSCCIPWMGTPEKTEFRASEKAAPPNAG